MWGFPQIKKREFIVATIFLIPMLPLFILNAVTFGKLSTFERIINAYGNYAGKHVTQRLIDWLNKF